jgi:sulfur carrier protein ThiS adenylyltransferase
MNAITSFDAPSLDPLSARRAIRQRDLVPPVELGQWHALVVGVGAIGRQVALQLAAMGTNAMTIVDDDVVAEENLAVQGFSPHEIGVAKVEAVAVSCRTLLPELDLHAHPARFNRSSALDLPCLARPQRPKLAVFACVDSMSGRRMVFETVRRQAHLLVDGRMAGETVRVLSSTAPSADTYYPSTLFEGSQAHPAPCTGRSTLYAASIAAGLMLSRFAQVLRGGLPSRDVLLQLAGDELAVL